MTEPRFAEPRWSDDESIVPKPEDRRLDEMTDWLMDRVRAAWSEED